MRTERMAAPPGLEARNRSLSGAALQRLLEERFGRTTLMTNRLEWTAEQVAAAYAGQQAVERVFRGLKGGAWVGWGPQHWTDSKIRVHAFYCMLGLSLLQYLHQEAQQVWPCLTMEGLKEELSRIYQYELLYPRQGAKGPPRVATVVSKGNLAQVGLEDALGINELVTGTST